MQASDQERAFLDAVCQEVRWQAAHPGIRAELCDHIEDQKEALLRGGRTPDAAQEQTLRELGEPEMLGQLFDASYRPAATFGVLAPIILYALLGIFFRLAVYQMPDGGAWRDFIIALVFGGLVVALLFRLNLYRLGRFGWLAYAAFLGIVIVCPAVYSVVIGQVTPESTLYLEVRYLWMLFPLIYGLLLYRLRGLGFFGILAAAALVGVPFLMSAILFWSGFYWEGIACFASLWMLVFAIRSGFFHCNKALAIALILFFVLLSIVVFVISEPYRVARLLAVLNPARDPMGDGWLVLRIRELISHAAILGAGSTLPTAAQEVAARFGESTNSQSLLLAILAYRYGLAVAALPVIGLCVWIGYGITRVRNLGSTLGKLLASAILLVFGAQAVLSIAVFFGYPLWYSAVFPFLTDNTLAFLMNLLLAGLLASLLRTDGLYRDTQYRRKRLRLRLE